MEATPAVVQSLVDAPRPSRRARRVIRRFARHRLALAGLVASILLVFGAAAAPWITPYYPDQIDLVHRFAPPLSAGHFLGADELGRDVFTRLLYAGRISLSVGVSAMLVTLAVGFTAGAFAAYCGGVIDTLLMRLTDMALCFPNIFLLLFLAAFVTPTLPTVALIIGLTCWMEIARIVHSQGPGLKEQDFIKAARLSGASSIRLVLKQLLPNATAPLMVAATLNMANAILLES